MIYLGIEENNLDKEEVAYNKLLAIMPEIWKPLVIKGYRTHYSISNKGRVKNDNNNKILSSPKSQGYLKTRIVYKENKCITVLNHRSVALAFINLPVKYRRKGLSTIDLSINHRNEKRHHCAVFNLEWCTSGENIAHSKMNDKDKKKFSCIYLLKAIESINLNNVDKDTIKKVSRKYDIPKDIIKCVIYGQTRKTIIDNNESYYVGKNMFDFSLEGNRPIPYKYDVKQMKKLYYDLENTKMSNTELSKKYNINRQYIGEIRNGHFRKRETKGYDFMKNKHVPKIQNNELIHKVCSEIAEGKLRMRYIGEKYDIDESTMYEILHGKVRTDISSQYDFSHAKVPKSKNTELILGVLRDFEKGMHVAEISEKYGIDKTYAFNIKFGAVRKDLYNEFHNINDQ